jgi:SAM-dependent methyltransferase
MLSLKHACKIRYFHECFEWAVKFSLFQKSLKMSFRNYLYFCCMQQEPIQKFLERLKTSFESAELIKITLSKQRSKLSDLKSIIISPVQLKGGMMLNFVYRHQTNDITKNYFLDEALCNISLALQNDFFNADMYVSGENIRLLSNKKGAMKFLSQKVESLVPVSLAHDRSKERMVITHGNIWLRELHVTNEQWDVRHEMKDKFLQINRYIELLEPEISRLENSGTLKVADMGSGKGYLTFALYDFLQSRAGLKVEMKGIEYRKELVDICNRIAAKSEFNHLSFEQGSIEEAELPELDILIALHACDTATDEAIFKGISSQASLIVCAPCCQKQIRKEMQVDNEWADLLKHGILMERQAEILTDGLRALIMEANGYKTRVFEFISSEHTSKNIMLVGRKAELKPSHRKQTLETIEKLKRNFGIRQHYLEALLGV